MLLLSHCYSVMIVSCEISDAEFALSINWLIRGLVVDFCARVVFFFFVVIIDPNEMKKL